MVDEYDDMDRYDDSDGKTTTKVNNYIRTQTLLNDLVGAIDTQTELLTSIRDELENYQNTALKEMKRLIDEL